MAHAKRKNRTKPAKGRSPPFSSLQWVCLQETDIWDFDMMVRKPDLWGYIFSKNGPNAVFGHENLY